MRAFPRQDLGGQVTADVTLYGSNGCCEVELQHRTANGNPCTARLNMRGAEAVRVTSHHPLSIAGPVLCPYCGFAGTIQEGRFTPQPDSPRVQAPAARVQDVPDRRTSGRFA